MFLPVLRQACAPNMHVRGRVFQLRQLLGSCLTELAVLCPLLLKCEYMRLSVKIRTILGTVPLMIEGKNTEVEI